MNTTIRFQQHCVTNGTDKARVTYSMDNRADKRKCVTIYAKDYGRPLARVFKGMDITVENGTDSMTDYFDTDSVTLFEGHEFYPALRERAEANNVKDQARYKERRMNGVDRVIIKKFSAETKQKHGLAKVEQWACERVGVDLTEYRAWKYPAAAPAPVVEAPVAAPVPVEEVTRHDYPNGFRRFMDKAVELGVADAMSIMCLGIKHGTNWKAAMEEVLEWAFVNRHTKPEQHHTLCAWADNAAPLVPGTIPGAGGLSTTDTPAPQMRVVDPFGMVERALHC